MSYSIEFDGEQQIVYVIYHNSVSLNQRIQAVKDVISRFADYSPLKLLVDVRDLIMDLSFDEQQRFGKYLANHSGLQNARVAVLHKSDYNPNIVIDSTAFSNGYKIAQFNAVKEAVLWLNE